MECWRRAVVDSGLDRGTGAPGRARCRRGYSGEVWVGVGMPSSEEEGAASGRGGPGKRNRRRRGAHGVGGSQGLLLEGRGVGATPARWAGVGVPSYEEGGVGGGREREIGGGVARARRRGRPGAPR